MFSKIQLAGQKKINFNAGAFSGANVTVDFYNSK